MKKLVGLILILWCGVCFADVEVTRSKEQVDKVDDNSISVTIPVSQKEVISYEDLLVRKNNLEDNLKKLEADKIILDKNYLVNKAAIQENILLYGDLITKAKELGVKEKTK